MTPEQFRAWRKGLKLKQKEAADLLGLKKRMIQYYETGTREGKKVKIPKYIRLACHALSQGIEDFDGVTAMAISHEAWLRKDDDDQNALEDNVLTSINGHTEHFAEDAPESDFSGDVGLTNGNADQSSEPK